MGADSVTLAVVLAGKFMFVVRGDDQVWVRQQVI